jgi:hypothetical protein
MQEDKAWERIVDAIDTKYGLKDFGKSKRPVDDAHELTEYVAYIIFEREGTKYRLERLQTPAILERKTMGARRAGATVRMQNIYDPHEFSYKTNLYKDNAGDWEPVDPSALGL